MALCARRKLRVKNGSELVSNVSR
uniref:Uncharacterized protein n=1 Tax=Anguilla anguilla TaxID=7936 RepID=A0A0E9RZE4_ANGAN